MISVPHWLKNPFRVPLRIPSDNSFEEVVSRDETNQWLYVNRLERMDATIDLFDEKRRLFHLDRYYFAAERVKGMRVIDCACGTGYGVRMLREAGRASYVVGADIEAKAIEYACKKHRIDSTLFVCSSGDHLALSDASFDMVVSFETIEHVPDDDALLKEFHRVLRPDGVLIMSTPNQWPLETAPFHVKEYNRKSFIKILETYFDCLELYNQNSGCDTPFNHGQARGMMITTPENEHLAECYIAVCRRKD